MREFCRPFRFGIGCFVLLFAAAGLLDSSAQTTARPVNPPIPEELNQAELLEAYRSMREQLRATQTAIVNNRFESEANARAQAAAIAEKIDAMNAVLAAERKNRQAENDRFEYERERQQAELRRSNRAVVWVASGFGALGLLAMVCAALFQWRAINRMAEVVDQRPALPAPSPHGLLTSGALQQTGAPLALSSQRLMTAIERMEQRIKELEHTAGPLADPGGSTPPTGSTPATPTNESREAIA